MTCYDLPLDTEWSMTSRLPGIWRYAPLLPVENPVSAVSLGEGNTPLVRSLRLGEALGIQSLWFKIEAGNPTGSYKDRIAAVAISRAKETGRRGWIATSSGNAGAALAAYGARAGLPGIIVVPTQASPAKLSQIQAYGPCLIAVEGFGLSPEADAAVFSTLADVSVERDWALSITAHAFDPYAMDGAKTIAFEIAEQLGRAPDRVYVPAGGGGLATSLWRGFLEWHALGRIAALPHLVVVQPEGCAPIVHSLRRGTDLIPVPYVETTISGVQLADPPDGGALLHALRYSNGSAIAVPDNVTYEVQVQLARKEGIFVEPAAALAVAGLIADFNAGHVTPDETIVCVLTGSGLKDIQAAERMATRELTMGPIGIDSLKAALVDCWRNTSGS